MIEKKWWHAWRWTRPAAVAVAVFIAAVFKVLYDQKVLTDAKWPPVKGVLTWTLVATAALVCIDSVLKARTEFRRPALNERRLAVHKPVLGMLVALSIVIDEKVTELGGNVYVVRKGFVRSGLRVGREARLHRIERVRLSDYPQPSSVRFARGKGAIGKCWDSNRPEHVDLFPRSRRWASKEITEEQWSKIPDGTKCGFSRQEFIEVVGKYAEVFAMPIKGPTGDFIGCLAVDRIYDDQSQHKILLDSQPVKVVVNDTAAGLAELVNGR
ncbi:hypothetical protein [Kribbella sp. VKM Ac-2568]|uniref:hypothetical protein n=1 Tax=Kribbella sp. VKM Ac-2568 TaxID=2512219 RepID=UPI00104D0E62|nr:hypothetical protein [Kribbella sp. VKM Ac-2568]TCM49391.1 hypothetical protein EV648_103664 [Kribbella sp. VKM Ac-2568]